MFKVSRTALTTAPDGEGQVRSRRKLSASTASIRLNAGNHGTHRSPVRHHGAGLGGDVLVTVDLHNGREPPG